MRDTTVTCEILRDFGRVEALAGEWQRLWQSTASAEIFQSFMWTRAWWRAFGENYKLCIATVRQNGRLVFILPLIQEGQTLRFLGSPQLDYADAVSSNGPTAEWLALCLTTLLLELPEWRECVLDHLRRDSHIVKCWGKLPPDLRRRIHLDTSHTCPTIEFRNKKDEVLGSLLAGKHLRRRLNKLNKAGELTFRHIEDRLEAERQLNRFFQSHRRRCAVLAKKSCFDDPQMRAMMHALIGEMDLRTELRFGVLELDGGPLAWSFGFQSNGKYSYYQQTFDIDAEEYVPGEVLLRFLLLYSKENVEREFDFLRGDEFFKKRYATRINRCYRLYVERPGIIGQALRLKRGLQGQFRSAASRVENFVRNREKIFQHFRAYLIWKRDWSRRVQRAHENRQATNYILSAASSIAWRKLWKKSVAAVFSPSETVIAIPPLVDPQIAIKPGRLSDLADLALDHPEIAFPSFREYRNRFKRGDEVYLVYWKGHLNLVAWTRLMDLDTATATPCLSFYECWPVGDATEACAHLLTDLAKKASQRDLHLIVSCSALPTSCTNAIRQQRLSAHCKIESHAFLGGRIKRIRTCADSGQESGQNVAFCPKLRKGNAPRGPAHEPTRESWEPELMA